MANREHLIFFKQGADVWNKWRARRPGIKPHLAGANFNKAYLREFYLREADLRGADLKGADLREVDLSRADLRGADLIGADLIGADLNHANLTGADLSQATLRESNLSRGQLCGACLNRTDLGRAYLSGADFSRADLTGADLSKAKLNGTDLSRADLRGADLSKAYLKGTYLIGADLSGVDLIGADLSKAYLIATHAIEANFTGAIFTGTCLEDWKISSATKLDGVICDYVYLKAGQQERRPSSENFSPGEFTKLFHSFADTIDLVFREGLDWQAFAYSFKKLEAEHSEAQVAIQNIENKGNEVVVIKMNVAPDADKSKIHGAFIQSYELAQRTLDSQYQPVLDDNSNSINNNGTN
ncbi:MAG: pentapeptide repeat-containing protein [Cyanothece sp. SIO1E1]|nr:pentapeptide repeat-containing protein [Cyanothece sp. SIO1E1]